MLLSNLEFFSLFFDHEQNILTFKRTSLLYFGNVKILPNSKKKWIFVESTLKGLLKMYKMEFLDAFEAEKFEKQNRIYPVDYVSKTKLYTPCSLCFAKPSN